MTDLEPTVRAGGLLGPGRPVLVMYSGGRDSTCLLELAVRIAGPDVVRALHVDYGLRADAAADADHCAATCAALGVPLEVYRPRRSPDAAGNLQAWARGERYGAASRRLSGAELAAGHTATDQLETILYRLASSPSRRALRGMRAREPLPAVPGRATLVRPLLGVTREQTGAHCRTRGLAFRDDASNDADRFARGRIRTELVPALERVHPAAAANVLALAELLAAEGEVLDELVDGVLVGVGAADGVSIPVRTLRAQPPALRRLIVQRLADAAAGGPAAGVARRAEEVAALPERGTAALHLPHGVRASVRGGVIRFDRTPPRRPSTGPAGADIDCRG